MLSSPKSRMVLESIFDAALDNEHKNQAAAWKLVVDRIMPLSYFEKDKIGGGKSAINISITGIGGETIVSSGDSTIDGEVIDE